MLTDAYRDGAGIAQGGKTFTGDEVRLIVDTLDVVVFPQANPDGRHYSMTVDPMWRKNRRPAEDGAPPCVSGGGDGPGVDVNRNYDFLWDFPTKFSPSAPVVTSTDPGSDSICGRPAGGLRGSCVFVQRVVLPDSRHEAWTVVGDDAIPIEPVERYLAFLTDVARSPNTVRAYAHDLEGLGSSSWPGGRWTGGRCAWRTSASSSPGCGCRRRPDRAGGGAAVGRGHCTEATINRKLECPRLRCG